MNISKLNNKPSAYCFLPAYLAVIKVKFSAPIDCFYFYELTVNVNLETRNSKITLKPVYLNKPSLLT